MLKKITRDQARIGMYIQELCAEWYRHPFLQRSFLIRDAAMLAMIRGGSVEEMWIDTSKGVDPGRTAELVARSRAAVGTLFQQARMGQPATLRQAAPLVDDIIASVAANAGAMLGQVRLRRPDDYTHMHSVAVCALMVALALHMGMDRASVRDCGMAGLLHDIGKAVVPPAILNKPGQLSRAEFAAAKLHAVAGHAMLRAAGGMPGTAIDVCLQHHERYDGTGYPAGLSGDAISLPARMAAVCDVYDAITAHRPYKAPWSPELALRRMKDWTAQGHFDPAVFGAFVHCIGPRPPAGGMDGAALRAAA